MWIDNLCNLPHICFTYPSHTNPYFPSSFNPSRFTITTIQQSLFFLSLLPFHLPVVVKTSHTKINFLKHFSQFRFIINISFHASILDKNLIFVFFPCIPDYNVLQTQNDSKCLLVNSKWITGKGCRVILMNPFPLEPKSVRLHTASFMMGFAVLTCTDVYYKKTLLLYCTRCFNALNIQLSRICKILGKELWTCLNMKNTNFCLHLDARNLLQERVPWAMRKGKRIWKLKILHNTYKDLNFKW